MPGIAIEYTHNPIIAHARVLKRPADFPSTAHACHAHRPGDTCPGRDATTGLLREAVEAPQDGPVSPEGPLGMLRRRMTLLDAGQVHLLGVKECGGPPHPNLLTLRLQN